MSLTKNLYGELPTGEKIYKYLLDNGTISAEIINYGGIITRLLVPDNNGRKIDVVLGRESLQEYLNNDGYIGAAIGRYANRIKKGQFSLGGIEYNVGINEGLNSLHGGVIGFDKKVWNVTEVPNENAIILSYISFDGEEGFPGTLNVAIKYSITDENSLKIEYRAVSDKDTICNLTNHSYFNLGGHDSGKIDEQILQLNCSFYTPNNDECMPTGEILSVNGTPFDFRTSKPIGQDINADYPQITMVDGYDHNFIIDGFDYRIAAVATCPKTGITMSVYTNQPGMQLYTANALPQGVYKDKYNYSKHGAFCLETQSFPNAMAYSHFQGPILKKGETYSHITEYKFI